MTKKLHNIECRHITVKEFNKIRTALAILLLIIKLHLRDLMREDQVLNMIWKMKSIIDKNKKIKCGEIIESHMCKIITMILRANRADQIVSQKNTKSSLEVNLMGRE
jgi:hypothetical protein